MQNIPIKRPLLGIMRLMPRTAKSPGPLYSSFLRLGAKLPASVCIFSPSQINWTAKKVLGFILSRTPAGSKIYKRTLPLPRVVYNRLGNRLQEASSTFRLMRSRFPTLGIKMFNPKFFNKIEVYRYLRQVPLLTRHLPVTWLAFSLSNLTAALHRFPAVYIKPSGGSLGIGVMKVTRLPGGYLVQAHAKGRKRISFKVTSIPQLHRRIARFAGRRPVIQQSVNLAKYHGRIFDMRVLMQKDGSGNWLQTYSFGKLAAPGSVISNVAGGGSVVGSWRLINSVFTSQAQRQSISTQITQITRSIAQCLDRHYRYLGELGIDLGIDQSGKVWIIEVNSKYQHHVFPRQIKVTSMLRPLNYAVRLARGGR